MSLTDLFKAWRKANIGDVIELWATEPTAEKDVRAWAKKSGNRVIESVQGKDYTRVVVEVTKKGKSQRQGQTQSCIAKLHSTR